MINKEKILKETKQEEQSEMFVRIVEALEKIPNQDAVATAIDGIKSVIEGIEIPKSNSEQLIKMVGDLSVSMDSMNKDHVRQLARIFAKLFDDMSASNLKIIDGISKLEKSKDIGVLSTNVQKLDQTMVNIAKSNEKAVWEIDVLERGGPGNMMMKKARLTRVK